MAVQAVRKLMEDKPLLLIGSPLCTDWCTMMHLNRGKPDPKEPRRGIPGSNTKGCEGEGLMSYGSKTTPTQLHTRPDAWSTCSNTDFIKFYRKTGHRCLRRNGNVDDDVMLCNSKIIISAPL